MVYVEVLYKDLSRQRVPIEDIDQLPNDGVLIIVVTAPKDERYEVVAYSHSKDHYSLLSRGDWVLLCGWDDSEWQWRRIRNPWESTAFQTASYLPFGCLSVTFHGVSVHPDVWKEAVGIFDEDMNRWHG